MKDLLSRINKVFENRVRLGLMTLLMVNERIDFNQVKELLDLTDGNLASHISTMEKAGYLKVNKSFQGKKTFTAYKATEAGRLAFKNHLEALELLLKSGENKQI